MTLNLPEPTTLILSRDELLSALNALEATTISGIDSEPTGPRTEQEMLLAQEVATRSLRARGLARYESGTVLYEDRLLDIVGTCAYPKSALTAFHWASAEDEPVRFFGFVRNDVYVAHTRPEALMHRFDMYSESQQMANALIRFYQIDDQSADVNSTQKVELLLESETFSTIRQLSEAGNTEEAQDLLLEHQVAESAASQIATLFTDNPTLTVFQTVAEIEADAVVKRDFMLAQTNSRLWFVGAVDDTANGPLQVKDVTIDEILSLLTGWI